MVDDILPRLEVSKYVCMFRYLFEKYVLFQAFNLKKKKRKMVMAHCINNIGYFKNRSMHK